MYQVVKMYGEMEPWWFLEGWEEDIVEIREFTTYTEAFFYYKMEYNRLALKFSKNKTKQSTLSAFWSETEQIWCEECEEYLQQFHSILLLESANKLQIKERNRPSTGQERYCKFRKKREIER